MDNYVPATTCKTLSSTTDLRPAISKRRTAVIDSLITDKDTGEIIGTYTFRPYQSEKLDKSTCPCGSNDGLAFYTDDDGFPEMVVTGELTAPPTTKIPTEEAPTNTSSTPDQAGGNPRGAGRRPKATENPVADIIGLLSLDKPKWLDDILFGSCLTAAGQSGNICNVSMNAVLGALHMKTLEVGPVEKSGVGKRKAQLVIKSARHAANGIHQYLLRYPALMEKYSEIARIDSKYAYSHVAAVPFPPMATVPQHITDLYRCSDYLAYGMALRAFRGGQLQSEPVPLLAA